MTDGDKHPEGYQPYMTVADMVREIHSDVKDLQRQAARMEQARDQVHDHEARLRSLEVWKYGIPFSGIVALTAIVTDLLVVH